MLRLTAISRAGTIGGVAICLLAPAAALTPAASAAGPAEADRRLDRALHRLIASPGGPPGAIAVIQRRGAREVHSAGVAELGGRAPRGGDRMRIASTSKAISGAAALALVADGALALEATIGELLPNLPAAWHAVTLAQLLNHTSGIPDFSASPGFGPAVGASPLQGPPPRELLEFVAGEPLEFPPGSDYRYSNSDNIVVALIVQRVAGKPYPRHLREQIFKPQGMGRSALRRPAPISPPLIHGYDLGPETTDVSEEIAFGAWAWASGGVLSTPANLNRFIRSYVGGQLFAGAARNAQLRFYPGAESSPPGPGGNAAGLALFRYRTRCGTVFGHTGSILGYTQLIAANRNGRRSLTFSINTQADQGLLPALRRAQANAVCAALARRG